MKMRQIMTQRHMTIFSDPSVLIFIYTKKGDSEYQIEKNKEHFHIIRIFLPAQHKNKQKANS